MTIRDELLAIRGRIDALLAELPETAGAPRQTQDRRFLSVGDFAELRGYSARTIRDWCDLGMPHSGDGRGRRVHVAEAITWIDTGGPKRARMGRKDSAA